MAAAKAAKKEETMNREKKQEVFDLIEAIKNEVDTDTRLNENYKKGFKHACTEISERLWFYMGGAKR